MFLWDRGYEGEDWGCVQPAHVVHTSAQEGRDSP